MPQAPRVRVLFSTNEIISPNKSSKFILSARNMTITLLDENPIKIQVLINQWLKMGIRPLTSKATKKPLEICTSMLTSHSHITLTTVAQMPIKNLAQVRIAVLANTFCFHSKAKKMNRSNAGSIITLGTCAKQIVQCIRLYIPSAHWYVLHGAITDDIKLHFTNFLT